MDIKLIKTKVDYKKALAEVERLMSATKNTPDGDRLDVLITLLEKYESEHFPMDFPDPIEAIKFVMDQRGLSAKDLVPTIGQQNRVYEILNRKRMLTREMIYKLHKELNIPAEVLILPITLVTDSNQKKSNASPNNGNAPRFKTHLAKKSSTKRHGPHKGPHAA